MRKIKPPRPESGNCRQIQEYTAMRIHNLYEDANGESHFRDIEIDWIEEAPTGKLSKRLPASGIMFRETTTDYENSWHRLLGDRRRLSGDTQPRLIRSEGGPAA